MAKMKYSIRPAKNRETGEVLAYAYALSDPLDLETIARDVTQETTVTETDVVAVLKAYQLVLMRKILEGYSVSLGDVGSIYPTYSSEGCDDMEKFSSSLIKGVRIRFRPGTKLKKEVQKAEFQLILGRKDEKAGIKALKTRMQDAIDGSGGGDGDDNP